MADAVEGMFDAQITPLKMFDPEADAESLFDQDFTTQTAAVTNFYPPRVMMATISPSNIGA